MLDSQEQGGATGRDRVCDLPDPGLIHAVLVPLGGRYGTDDRSDLCTFYPTRAEADEGPNPRAVGHHLFLGQIAQLGRDHRAVLIFVDTERIDDANVACCGRIFQRAEN